MAPLWHKFTFLSCVVVATLSAAGSNAIGGDGIAFYKGPDDAQLAPRNALVLGVSVYNSFPQLRNALNDARAISTVLEKLGFDVYPKDNSRPLTRQKFKTILYDYVRRVKRSGGTSVIFFAGHGVSYGGASYLVPFDGMARYSRDVREELLPLDLISDALQEMKNAYHIVILDACRDSGLGQLPALGKGDIVTITSGIGFKAPLDIVLATSADDGQKAKDGMGENSPYAVALLKFLPMPNLRIGDTFAQVAQFIRAIPSNIGDEAQEPVYKNKGGAVFYFAPTVDSYNDEKRIWDEINTPNAPPWKYETFLRGYPVGYFSTKAWQIKNSWTPSVLVPAPAMTVKVVSDNVKLRDGPSSNANIDYKFKRGTLLRAYSQDVSETADWTLVRRKSGDTGYVATKDLVTLPPTQKELALTYSGDNDVPKETLSMLAQQLNLSHLQEIKLIAYVSDNVGTTILRLVKIQTMLSDQLVNPKIVKTEIQRASRASETTRIDVIAQLSREP